MLWLSTYIPLCYEFSCPLSLTALIPYILTTLLPHRALQSCANWGYGWNFKTKVVTFFFKPSPEATLPRGSKLKIPNLIFYLQTCFLWFAVLSVHQEALFFVWKERETTGAALFLQVFLFFLIPGDVVLCCYSWFLVTPSHRSKRSEEGGWRGAWYHFSWGKVHSKFKHISGLISVEFRRKYIRSSSNSNFGLVVPTSASSYNVESVFTNILLIPQPTHFNGLPENTLKCMSDFSKHNPTVPYPQCSSLTYYTEQVGLKNLHLTFNAVEKRVPDNFISLGNGLRWNYRA